MIHKRQETHDVIITYDELRAWVRAERGLELPAREVDVTIEVTTKDGEFGVAIMWSTDWKTLPAPPKAARP